MKRWAWFLAVFLIVIGVGGIFLWQSKFSGRAQDDEKEIHLHAGFKVFIDGKLQDYSDLKFMDIEPCNTPGHKVNEDEQKEKAHLHDNIGDIVHVHREGAVWGDLFQNIGVKFDNSKEVEGYEDGVMVPTILNKPIQPYESVVIVVGDQTTYHQLIKDPVTTEHIKEVESKSETCGGTVDD